MTCQSFPHTNAWGRKFDFTVKRSKVNGEPMDIIWANLVDIESSMLYTKILLCPKALLVLEKYIFKCLHYMDSAAILINGPWPFVQIFNLLLTERFTWRLGKMALGFQRRSRSNVSTDGRTDDDRWQTSCDHNSSSWAFGSLAKTLYHACLIT